MCLQMRSFLSIFVMLLCLYTTCNAFVSVVDLIKIYQAIGLDAKQIKKYLHQLVYGKKQDYCAEDPISKCSCYEMLLTPYDLDPNIIEMNHKDIRRLYKIAKTKYDGNAKSFNFLTKCKESLSRKKDRVRYTEELQGWLSLCLQAKLNEETCRQGIADINDDQIVNPNVQYTGIVKVTEPETLGQERTFIFLDNSVSMSGTYMIKGRNFLRKIKSRITDSSTCTVHLIGGKTESKMIVNSMDGPIKFNKYILERWKGEAYGTYLWEYIYNTVSFEVELGDSCEIILVISGHDDESSGRFQGIQGYDELMSRLYVIDNIRCRVFIYCISLECKEKTGKDYMDLALGSGGYICDDDNEQECFDIINMPSAVRDKLGRQFTDEYYKLIKSDKARDLPWLKKNCDTN